MKKCPNCKKPVPFGARKCVHCRTSLIDNNSEPSSTRMGVGGGYSEPDFNYNRAESTSFGRPSSKDRDDMYSQGDARAQLGQMNKAFNENPHQTMLGLGPVTAGSVRNNPWVDQDTGFAQTTISGMPGISFDPGSSSMGNQYRPALNLNNPQINADPLRRSSREEQNSFIREEAPSIPEPKPKTEPVKPPEPEVPAPAEDALFGLPGVAAPVPSSLVDEEFTDLTSQLFGEEFAQVNQEDDDEDEDDGFDFDSPAPVAVTPVKPAEPVATKEKTEDKPEASTSKKSESKKSESGSKTKKTTKGSKKSEPVEEFDDEDDAPVAAAAAQDSPWISRLACISAVLMLACVGIGIATDAFSASGGDFILLAVILCALVDGAYLLFSQKSSKSLWMACFAISALVLLGAVFATAAGGEMIYILLAVAAQIACAAILFVKN